jgi:Emfourin
MKVVFVQSGGVTGVVKGCEIDTQALAPEDATAFQALVAGSGIFASGEFVSVSARDLSQYEITIEESGARIALVCDDETVPASAKPLLGYLKQRARPQRPT